MVDTKESPCNFMVNIMKSYSRTYYMMGFHNFLMMHKDNSINLSTSHAEDSLEPWRNVMILMRIKTRTRQLI